MRRLLRRLIPAHRRRAKLLADLQTRTGGPAGHPNGGGRPRLARRMPNGGAYYRRVEREPISPAQVRDRRFTDSARRGCDPGEVHAFLHLVADELAALRAELATTRAENLRIKQALRDWQPQFHRWAPS
ncbi:DivIVA domain-containing protein [Solwaraspora sp. WMMD1047]|uniref:DivIVA domain-containing protein n=1 Tax=Solwaraspora sp. WMMD1047 TaxID=3016102 RepID=UPI00241636FD|nr:DivIVA domain-containing protein [Solwaraspora sp. WMMD1047]MDG4828857.1 DivIVA domain-containing protein [Solwaraspora sp. WMMD1047]